MDYVYAAVLAFAVLTYICNALRDIDETLLLDHNSPDYYPFFALRTNFTVVHAALTVFLALIGCWQTALILCGLYQIFLVLIDLRYGVAKVPIVANRLLAVAFFADAYFEGDVVYGTIVACSGFVLLFKALHEASLSPAFVLGNSGAHQAVFFALRCAAEVLFRVSVFVGYAFLYRESDVVACVRTIGLAAIVVDSPLSEVAQ